MPESLLVLVLSLLGWIWELITKAYRWANSPIGFLTIAVFWIGFLIYKKLGDLEELLKGGDKGATGPSCGYCGDCPECCPQIDEESEEAGDNQKMSAETDIDCLSNAPEKTMNKPIEYEYDFHDSTDQELIHRFNGDTGHCGWTSARGRFLCALFDEMYKRFDCSAIGDKKGFSMAQKIKLEGKKIVPIAGIGSGGGSAHFADQDK